MWVVPLGEDVWAKREPVHPSEQSEREPVPDRFLHARAAYLIGDSCPSMSMECRCGGHDPSGRDGRQISFRQGPERTTLDRSIVKRQAGESA